MKKFYFLWIYAVVLAAVLAGGAQSLIEEHRLNADETEKASVISGGLEETLLIHFHAKRFDRIAKAIKRLPEDQRVLGAALCVYDSDGDGLSGDSRGFPPQLDWKPICFNAESRLAAMDQSSAKGPTWFSSTSPFQTPEARNDLRIQYYAHYLNPAHAEVTEASNGRMVLVLVRDLSYLRSVWIESFLRGFGVVLTFGTALLILITSQMRRWLQSNLKVFHKSIRSLIAGRRPKRISLMGSEDDLSDLKPITEDLHQLATILSLRPKTAPPGSSDRNIFTRLQGSLAQKNLVVIANREPYIHQQKQDKIDVVRPASGLVTALEPILRQCGGLWIAHGSGTADAEVVDANNEVRVPPENPTYRLRRVFLSKEEEEGYYYGFSNEGLWALCHLAHNRPIFRLSDWQSYIQANQKFAAAIPEENLNSDSIFLVQDYHFALLPKFLRERALNHLGPEGQGRAPRIGIFWHIPWPNPEAFGISPWSQELLQGMLGADVIGFHTQYHCNNFLETCNRYLEARVDNERFSVTMGNHETLIRAFPIGIDTSPVRVLSDAERIELKSHYGIVAEKIAVGVDRIDYTKGIIERVEAVERFLEKNPEMIGKFSLVQMGSPSRTHIPAYRALYEQLEQVVQRINQRFTCPGVPEGYKPILFLAEHHEWKDIQYFYQLGDICMVTSLHDGMNLVAKEYVWCQSPERGSLILSKFTGASRELTSAFIVNPYSIEEMADAIASAIALSPEEKARRMMAMREKVHSQNAYHWAADLIDSLVKKGETGSSPIEQTPLPIQQPAEAARERPQRGSVGRRDMLKSTSGSDLRVSP